MRILVTGGAGFIASHVSEAYLASGHDVCIVDDLSGGQPENLPHGANFSQIDIRNADQLEKVFVAFRPEVVNHHAAQLDIRRSLREPIFDAEVNVVGSVATLDLSAKYGVRKVIFASSGGAIYGEPEVLPVNEATPAMPISHYGVTKLAVERYLSVYKHIYGLQYMVLRYANVYGPRQNPEREAGVVAIFAGQMLKKEIPTIFGDGSKTRDYVFIDDIVAANLLALNHGDHGVYNLGWGVQVSDYQVFDVIRECTGFEREPHYAPRRPGEIEHIALDASHAAIGLNWKPKVSFTEGITRTVEYIRSCLDLETHKAKKLNH